MKNTFLKIVPQNNHPFSFFLFLKKSINIILFLLIFLSSTSTAFAGTQFLGDVFSTTWASSISGASNYSPSSGYVFSFVPQEDMSLEKVWLPYTRHPSGNCSGTPAPYVALRIYQGSVDGSTFGTPIATSTVLCSSLYVHDGTSHTNNIDAISAKFLFTDTELTGGTTYHAFIHSVGGLYMRYLGPSTGTVFNYNRLPTYSTPDWDATNRRLASILSYSTPSTGGDSVTRLIPYNKDDMPKLETVVCDVATCTLNYSATSTVYADMQTIGWIFLLSILVAGLGAFLAYKFL